MEIHSVFLGFGVYSYMCSLPDVCSQNSMLKHNPATCFKDCHTGNERFKCKTYRQEQLYTVCAIESALALLHRPPLGSHGATIKLWNNRGTYGVPRRRRLLNVCSHWCRIRGHTLHRSLWSPLQTVALYGVLRNIGEMGALLHPEPVNVTCYLTLWMYVNFIMW